MSNIRAIRKLWGMLNEKGVPYITMRHLNQDPLENFFGVVRQLCASNTNPTVEQFVSAFKTCLVTNLTSSFVIRGTN